MTLFIVYMVYCRGGFYKLHVTTCRFCYIYSLQPKTENFDFGLDMAKKIFFPNLKLGKSIDLLIVKSFMESNNLKFSPRITNNFGFRLLKPLSLGIQLRNQQHWPNILSLEMSR